MVFSLSLKTLAILALAFVVCVQATQVVGGIVCEDLNKDKCAFAVSSSGNRCVLEKLVRRTGEYAYECRSSEIEAYMLKDWVETDQCIEACGLDRSSLGISSDSLLEPRFTQKLCSPQCYESCPNIVDLYFHLAAGEGAFLPKLCKSQGEKARRELSEIKSSGFVTPGPESGATVANLMVAPAMSPWSGATTANLMVASAMAPF